MHVLRDSCVKPCIQQSAMACVHAHRVSWVRQLQLRIKERIDSCWIRVWGLRQNNL